ncbi:acyl-CoA dehydrogenase family protein [Alteromonas sp. a30]|uniref:acyl-CoA dehydrogenase family protein n=1 Tax=Alteromonas sp. a30 TaxID=2730917 RepID=UPI0022804D01|nr:acyl-CoA dehydrogenase family protein [Alteromonas sp. a30]MCY7296473.1 acyl-CoA dehydrogenase [Alteromonas sp. a30]
MYEWTEDQKALRHSINEWSEALNTEYPEDMADRDVFLKRWETVKQTGITALLVAEQYGGLEQDILSAMYVMENFGRICDDAGLSFGLSTHIVSTGLPIQRFGNDAQKEKYLPLLAAGEKIGAHAITEAEVGSDAWNMDTHADKNDNGDFVLNGSKTFCSNGPIADTFIVYARTNADAGTLGGFTAFIVDKGTPGFTQGQPMHKMGLQSSTLCDLFFDDVVIPKENVLGKEGQGFSIFNYVMKWEILISFVINVGEMESLLQKTIAYSKHRKQYGEPICKYQAVSHKIANMKIGLETSRAMLYKAGSDMHRKVNSTTSLAMAKVVTSEAFVAASLDAQQIFGGYGYMKEAGIEKYLRNSVASKIYSGSSEVQRNTIASMLGL